MATFIMRRRLTDEEIQTIATQVEAWFRDNPRRRVCHAKIEGMMRKLRRGHVVEDIRAGEGLPPGERP